MKTRNILLVLVIIVIILVLLGVIYSNKKLEKIDKINKIDVSRYEKTSSGLLSISLCENNNFCRQEFNEYWKCQSVDNNERCICILTDENNPVCGVDERNYRNPSEANCLGVEIAYSGNCIITENKINDRDECTKDSDCPAGQICESETVCTSCLDKNGNPIDNCECVNRKICKQQKVRSSFIDCVPNYLLIASVAKLHQNNIVTSYNLDEILVEQKLKEISAYCSNGKIFDGFNKEIKFFESPCLGYPARDEAEIQERKEFQKKATESLKKLVEQYTVIVPYVQCA